MVHGKDEKLYVFGGADIFEFSAELLCFDFGILPRQYLKIKTNVVIAL